MQIEEDFILKFLLHLTMGGTYFKDFHAALCIFASFYIRKKGNTVKHLTSQQKNCRLINQVIPYLVSSLHWQRNYQGYKLPMLSLSLVIKCLKCKQLRFD